jgi:hypothetical protein
MGLLAINLESKEAHKPFRTVGEKLCPANKSTAWLERYCVRASNPSIYHKN